MSYNGPAIRQGGGFVAAAEGLANRKYGILAFHRKRSIDGL